LTVLASCAAADFVFLQGVTGLTKGNLSVQLTNLEQAGLVTITKEIIDKKTRTTVRLTQQGTHDVEEYWRTMDEIRGRMASKEKQPQAAEESSRLLPRDPNTQPA
jgi:DNA-binding PadR family transcriptional regulator